MATPARWRTLTRMPKPTDAQPHITVRGARRRKTDSRAARYRRSNALHAQHTGQHTASVVAMEHQRPAAQCPAAGSGQKETRRPPPRHRQAHTTRQPACGDGAQQRRQPVGPDAVIAAGARDLAHQLGGRRLQPVNPHRFFVAGDMAEADVHQVAGFHHLAGGLGEMAFVPVQRRKAEDAGQPQQQAQGGQQQKGMLGRTCQPAGDRRSRSRDGRGRGGFLSFYRRLCRVRPWGGTMSVPPLCCKEAPLYKPPSRGWREPYVRRRRRAPYICGRPGQG